MGYLFEMAGSFVQLTAQQEEGITKQKEALDNQSLANSAAADALARGNREAALLRMKGDQAQGALRAAYATSNVDASVGTPVQAAGQNAYFTELNAKTAENNALREAWGFKTYGVKYGQQAALESTRTTNRNLTTILGTSRDLGGAGAKYIRDQAESNGYGGGGAGEG